MIHIKKGLDIPINGAPSSVIEEAITPSTVALVGPDYNGMKPTFFVKESERISVGQPLFEDKKTPGAIFTSPGSGVVETINRGAKRAFQSVIIKLDGDEYHTFEHYSGQEINKLEGEQAKNLLIESGLWTSLRTRPYSKTPAIESAPHAIFVTAMDSNPLAPCNETILKHYPNEFITGLKILRKLSPKKLFLCKAPGSIIPGSELPIVQTGEFYGPHPAGLAGTHIHFLDPVGPEKTVWHIGCQDVVAIGHLFMTGRLHTEKIISIAGPQVNNPRLFKTRLGANINDLTVGLLKDGENRIISGSVLSGRSAQGPFSFLGRFHNQISVIYENRQKDFFGWLTPGAEKFSIKPLFLSSFLGKKAFNLTSSTNGSLRAIVPTECFEKVMPLDIEPTFLLRALTLNDTEQAQSLGCLELDEEDIALLTFVDASKNNFAPLLRKNLTLIEKEG